MGLPWVRLDTQFATNPKVVGLCIDNRYRAAFVYVTALAYAGAHGTDGYIPEHCLFLLHATKKEAQTLVEAGLWDVADGGWDIHGWDEFQVSDDASKKRRERAQKGGRASAQARAAKALEKEEDLF